MLEQCGLLAAQDLKTLYVYWLSHKASFQKFELPRMYRRNVVSIL